MVNTHTALWGFGNMLGIQCRNRMPLSCWSPLLPVPLQLEQLSVVIFWDSVHPTCSVVLFTANGLWCVGFVCLSILIVLAESLWLRKTWTLQDSKARGTVPTSIKAHTFLASFIKGWEIVFAAREPEREREVFVCVCFIFNQFRLKSMNLKILVAFVSHLSYKELRDASFGLSRFIFC